MKRFRIEISRALLVDPFMFMAEVVVLQPPPESLVNRLDCVRMPVLHNEVSLDEAEQAFDFPFGLGLPTKDKRDAELMGIPLVVGLSSSLSGLKLAAPVG